MALMIFITVILKEVKIMNNFIKQVRNITNPLHPFRVIVSKEITDHVKSWRFIILIGIIGLTCFGSMYTALSNIENAVRTNDPAGTFFFLKLFTLSDGSLPAFFVFIGFLGPLLG